MDWNANVNFVFQETIQQLLHGKLNYNTKIAWWAWDQNRARLRPLEAISILVCLPASLCYSKNKQYKLQKCEDSNKVLTFPMMNTSIVSLKFQILYSFKTIFFFYDFALLVSWTHNLSAGPKTRGASSSAWSFDYNRPGCSCSEGNQNPPLDRYLGRCC